VVVIVKIGHQRLNVAIGSAARLGIMREHVRRIESLLLSLRRVLSIYFQIVLVVIIRIALLELVVPRNYRTLGGVGHSVIEYVIVAIKVVKELFYYSYIGYSLRYYFIRYYKGLKKNS